MLDEIIDHPMLLQALSILEAPSLFSNLGSIIKSDPELQEKLLKCVKSSKEKETSAAVAANVLTLLAKAQIDMADQDFSGICVPNADLRAGEFSRAKFDEADLFNVDFRSARLAKASFKGANSKKARFVEGKSEIVIWTPSLDSISKSVRKEHPNTSLAQLYAQFKERCLMHDEQPCSMAVFFKYSKR